jgi:hypothetical protein
VTTVVLDLAAMAINSDGIRANQRAGDAIPGAYGNHFVPVGHRGGQRC